MPVIGSPSKLNYMYINYHFEFVDFVKSIKLVFPSKRCEEILSIFVFRVCGLNISSFIN